MAFGFFDRIKDGLEKTRKSFVKNVLDRSIPYLLPFFKLKNNEMHHTIRYKKKLPQIPKKADSNEIIKTPDAASITQPGRAYLQVGNNEIYELFQSAWSGARYAPTVKARSEEVDNRLWIINELGQYELATTDLSYSEETVSTDANTDETELDAVVEYIAQHAKNVDLCIPAKPWLPPLDEDITSPILTTKWTEKKLHKAPFALMDIPSEQDQRMLEFDLEEFSHSIIYASPGFGKSQALQTLVMNFARLNKQNQKHFI